MEFLLNGTSQHVSELLFVEVPSGMCKIHITENFRFFPSDFCPNEYLSKVLFTVTGDLLKEEPLLFYIDADSYNFYFDCYGTGLFCPFFHPCLMAIQKLNRPVFLILT